MIKPKPSTEERLERLERTLLGVVALATGEAAMIAKSPAEFELYQKQLASDMQDMANEMK